LPQGEEKMIEHITDRQRAEAELRAEARHGRRPPPTEEEIEARTEFLAEWRTRVERVKRRLGGEPGVTELSF
jgi:hypothetical protein